MKQILTKKCYICGRKILSSEPLMEIVLGIPMKDGTGWAMQSLQQFHAKCVHDQPVIQSHLRLILGKRFWRLAFAAGALKPKKAKK